MFRALLALSLLTVVSVGVYAADEAKPAGEAVKRLATDQWCWTHDFPKDKCAQCDPKLIPALKKDGDWCKEHSTAESLCVKCDPSVKDKLDAMRPAEKPKAAK
jgi:hypothetical protein